MSCEHIAYMAIAVPGQYRLSASTYSPLFRINLVLL